MESGAARRSSRPPRSFATVEGLDGLSIGRLADYVGMSKSGLFAHFGSKEELQLATIDAGGGRVRPSTSSRPRLSTRMPLDRLNALCERFLAHVEGSVFPGGCFFASAAAELDTRPGPVRERVAKVVTEWTMLIEQQIAEAQADGRIRADEDVEQLAFEIDALLLLANAQFLMMGNDPPRSTGQGAESPTGSSTREPPDPPTVLGPKRLIRGRT